MGCVPGGLGWMCVPGGGGWDVYQVGWGGWDVYQVGVDGMCTRRGGGLGIGGAWGVPGGLGVGCVPRGVRD